MPLEINDEERRILSPEDLENLQQAIDDFEAQAGNPIAPNGMRPEKMAFPIGISDEDSIGVYGEEDDEEEVVRPNFDNFLR